MSTRYVRILAIPVFVISSLCSCATNYPVYEAPTSGQVAVITLVNAAETQRINLATFDDGKSCTGHRLIQFDGKDGIPAGATRELTVAVGQVFTLFAALDTIEDDDYGVELGKTGGGPSPVRRRSVTAIGCSANLSFQIQSGERYRMVISEPESSRECSTEISATDETGGSIVVETGRACGASFRALR